MKGAREATRRVESWVHTYTGVLPAALPPVDEADDRTYNAVIAHVLGRATDEQITFLQEDPHDWRRILVAHKSRVMAILSTMNSEKTEKQQECWRRGPSGKQEWFSWLPQWETHRSLVVEHNSAVDRALALVNQLRQEEAESGEGSHGKLVAHVRRLEEMIHTLEARVSDLERGLT